MNTNSTNTTTQTNHTSVIAALKAELPCSASTKPARGFKRVGNKFAAQIGIGKAKIHLGMFDTAEEATAAYVAAKARVAELRQQQAQETPGDIGG